MAPYVDHLVDRALGPDLELVTGRGSSATEETALLFVHGLGHGAWCWERWQHLAAERGMDSWAMSFRGHGTSGGSVRGARLSDYVEDVRRTVAHLAPRPVVLVGHSMGGLVVQRVIAERVAGQVRGAVLLSSIPSGPAFSSLVAVATRHPAQAMRFMTGRPMHLPERLLFADTGGHQAQMKRLVEDSPRVQYQLLFHRRAAIPNTPVLVVGGTSDALVPLRTQTRTARRYDAEVRAISGGGHDLMLEPAGDHALDAILEWLHRPLESKRAARSTPKHPPLCMAKFRRS
jgi:pimeloyl-ACP methyl ester carboxylesterase